MRHGLRLSVLLFVALAAAGTVRAEDVTLSTEHSSPTGRYRTVNANERLDVGSEATSGDADLFGSLELEKATGDQTLAAWTSGGRMTIEGGLNIRDAAGATSLLFVDAATNRVGIGNSNPQMMLDVSGPVRAINIHSYADASTGDAGFFELFAASDAFETFVNEHVSVACHAANAPPGVNDFDLLPLYIDGNPLVLQGELKPGVVEAGGHGQVVIKGDPVPGLANVGLVVGYQNYGKAAANVVMPSSLEFKKDVQPLAPQDYQSILKSLDTFTVARYHYLEDSPGAPLQFGFIMEEAPEQVRLEGGISLYGSYGYLYAAAKALKADQDMLKARLEALKK